MVDSETFASYIENCFIPHYKTVANKTNVDNKLQLIKNHLIENNVFSFKRICNITKDDINDFYDLKLEKGYSISYIQKMYQMLNRAFEFAMINRLIIENPMKNAFLPKVRQQPKIIKLWTIEETKRFLEISKNEPHFLTFCLAIFTGMRKREILGLKWSDIDFSKKIINVERSLVYVQNKGYLLKRLKTNAIRKVTMPESIFGILSLYQKKQENWIKFIGDGFKSQDLVICRETGDFEDPGEITRVMKKILLMAKVPEIKFHDFRNIYVSTLISNGCSITTIYYLSGYTNLDYMLRKYLQLFKQN